MKFIENRLNTLKSKDLYREIRYLESAQGPRIKWDTKEYILMGSNNYLGLNHDERIDRAAIEAIKKYGTGSGGSRLTTGSYDLHKELEERIAEFKGTESALVFNTGYMANIGIISALCDKNWTLFCDKFNHASLVDGCKLTDAKMVRYKHCDISDLEKKLIKFKNPFNLIITDGVFSMDGTIAPLPEIVELAKRYDSMIMVDDAHGVGVLGENGAGTVSHFGLSQAVDIQVGTLSKAIPSVGGYVAGSKNLIDFLRNTSRSFIFSTALPPASIAASIATLDIIVVENEKREHLRTITATFKSSLLELGFNLTNTQSPILPILIGDPDKAIKISQLLLEDGIFIPAIRPPSVPIGSSRLRISLMATHDEKDLHYVLERLKHHAQQMGIIGEDK